MHIHVYVYVCVCSLMEQPVCIIVNGWTMASVRTWAGCNWRRLVYKYRLAAVYVKRKLMKHYESPRSVVFVYAHVRCSCWTARRRSRMCARIMLHRISWKWMVSRSRPCHCDRVKRMNELIAIVDDVVCACEWIPQHQGLCGFCVFQCSHWFVPVSPVVAVCTGSADTTL